MHQTLFHFGKAFLLGALSSIKHTHTHTHTNIPHHPIPCPQALCIRLSSLLMCTSGKTDWGEGGNFKMHLLNKSYPSPTPIPMDYFGLEISQYTAAQAPQICRLSGCTKSEVSQQPRGYICKSGRAGVLTNSPQELSPSHRLFHSSQEGQEREVSSSPPPPIQEE